MPDTIHIELPHQNMIDLQNNRLYIDDKTGEIISSIGYLDCIKVIQYSYCLRIEFSFPKFLKGNNIYSLEYWEVLEAIRKIELELGISLREGIIRRIDIFKNAETKYKPINYFRYLGDCRFFIRSVVKSTLYYKNNSREMYLYDKINEVIAKGGIIPNELLGKNLMRLECRYKNSFLKKFAKKQNLESLKVKDLFDEKTYFSLNNLIVENYNSIFKLNKTSMDFSKINTKKSLLEQLANEGIKSLGGINNVFEMIEESRSSNVDVRKEYYSRRKADVREISKLKEATFESNLICELNDKINENLDFNY